MVRLCEKIMQISISPLFLSTSLALPFNTFASDTLILSVFGFTLVNCGIFLEVFLLLFSCNNQVSVCPKCGGNGEVISEYCRKCSGEGRTRIKKDIKVKVPPGVSKGSILRVAKEGDAGPRGYVWVFCTVLALKISLLLFLYEKDSTWYLIRAISQCRLENTMAASSHSALYIKHHHLLCTYGMAMPLHLSSIYIALLCLNICLYLYHHHHHHRQSK